MNNKIKLFTGLLIIFFSQQIAAQTNNDTSNIDVLKYMNDPWVDSVMESLSLQERISQLFMVAAYSNKGESHFKNIDYLVRKYNIGGLIFFQGGPIRQAKLNNKYQSKAKTPLLVAMDAEWGLAMRLDSTVKYPRQMLLGAIQDDSLIYQMGQDIAEQCRRLGVHINFAPVADVNNNPNNPVINSRSFGENREKVSQKSIAYMKGMQDHGVIANAKHFPGHGDTDKDSHKTLPVVLHDKSRLDSIELYPFKQLIDAGIGSMMVAHLNIPALEPTSVPTTLSPKVVNELLKTEMGYQGLVFTDALNMKGVAEGRKPGDVECEALQAGNDILLFSTSVSKSIGKVKKAVKKGLIDESQINTSCRKVLAYKKWLGLDTINKEKAVEINNLYNDLNKLQYEVTKSRSIESAITLVSNKNDLLPLKKLDSLKIATISFGTEEISKFQSTTNYYIKADHYTATDLGNIDNILNTLKDYNLIITSIHNSNNSPWRKYGISDETINIIQELTKTKNVVLDIFANPYSLSYFGDLKNFGAVILSYEDKQIAQSLSAQAIFGAIEIKGKLPVSTNYFKEGHGIEILNPIRLKYTFPEDAGFSSEKLQKVDSIANNAISEMATPGCQILAAKDGKVFYRKSFGYQTYANEKAIDQNSIYDIASITKIVSTVPSLMRLYEEGNFDLNGKLVDFLPDLSETNKGDILIKDILTHQARLNGWIPFYFYTLKTINPHQKLRNNNFSKEYPNIVGPGFYIARNYTFKDSIFDVVKSDEYSVQVANNMYMNNSFVDTIYKMIGRSNLLTSNGYKYSDLGYYYFHKIIENKTGLPLEDYTEDNFFKSLEMNNTSYLPLHKFSKDRIAPTEFDGIFRNQLVHGMVHDPGAAMMGGIGGHAGVFSNADDLAKMMQMFLWNGQYGGKQFFKPETIELFTTSPFLDQDNRRALGFDKPQMDYEKVGPTCQCVSAKSFGHTGFTGTMAWVDPESGILYIFLSNRIHPDQDNSKLVKMDVRTDIQQAIHDAMIQ